jgi:hypothetical protein
MGAEWDTCDDARTAVARLATARSLRSPRLEEPMLILGIILGSLVGLVALLGIVGLLLSRKWRVERSIVMEAPPAAILPLINDFVKGWTQWNPFVEPGMKITYEGNASGVGAISKWFRGREEGRMEITESGATGIVYSIGMNNGFTMIGRILLEPQGGSTRVTWSDDGEVGNPFFRIMVLLMKGMIGGKLAQGLANMKKVVEKSPVAA